MESPPTGPPGPSPSPLKTGPQTLRPPVGAEFGPNLTPDVPPVAVPDVAPTPEDPGTLDGCVDDSDGLGVGVSDAGGVVDEDSDAGGVVDEDPGAPRHCPCDPSLTNTDPVGHFGDAVSLVPFGFVFSQDLRSELIVNPSGHIGTIYPAVWPTAFKASS